MIYISLILFIIPGKTAEEYYNDGSYDEALEMYSEYSDRGISNPNIYFNMGNCYYRMGDYGRALLYYRRAWFLDPGNQSIRHNISLLTNSKNIPNPIIQLISGAVDRISIRIFSYLLIISFTLFIILLSLKMIQTVRSVRFPVAPFLFITGIFLLFSLIGFGVWWGRVRSEWVVVTESTIACSGPGNQFKELMRMDEAEEGYLVREDRGWWLIHLHSGEGGWVDSTVVEKVLE